MSTRVCSGCRQLLPSSAFSNERVYECRPCRAAGARARYARRAARPLRGYNRMPPQGFAEAAGKAWDIDLAPVYGVSARTIRKWRQKLGIPPKDRLPHAAEWGRRGMRVLRELHPDLASGKDRPRKANGVYAAREQALERTGMTRPTLTTPHLGQDRALLVMAMQAFARSKVTEEDYA